MPASYWVQGRAAHCLLYTSDASPVEVREAQCVSGPLAVLDDFYGLYVTCPDDAQYRLDWIKEIYTPDMNNDYVYPNVFMSSEDTEQVLSLIHIYSGRGQQYPRRDRHHGGNHGHPVRCRGIPRHGVRGMGDQVPR